MKKVLIVDDIGALRKHVMRLIVELGFQCQFSEASNGKEGLEMAKKGKFDLYLLDWQMPEMTGIELLKALKENPRTRDVPAVMFTDQSKISNVEEAMSLGAVGYLSKPFDINKVDHKLHKYLA